MMCVSPLFFTMYRKRAKFCMFNVHPTSATHHTTAYSTVSVNTMLKGSHTQIFYKNTDTHAQAQATAKISNGKRQERRMCVCVWMVYIKSISPLPPTFCLSIIISIIMRRIKAQKTKKIMRHGMAT